LGPLGFNCTREGSTSDYGQCAQSNAANRIFGRGDNLMSADQGLIRVVLKVSKASAPFDVVCLIVSQLMGRRARYCRKILSSRFAIA
jgi:hypothetical protein